jgi:uncharacterized membrane protein YphA (DoxX/SURF4 family)
VAQPRGGCWPWLGLAARLLVGCVWLVAGVLKLPDPEQSVRAVRAYRLLPEAVVPAVGYGLPILEIGVGLLLVAGLATRVAGVISAVLFLLFVVGIASAWARGLQIDCGCFGGGGFDANASEQYPWEIARDSVLLALSAYLVARPASALAVDNRVLLRGGA